QGAQGTQGVQGAQGPQGASSATNIPFSLPAQQFTVPGGENAQGVVVWDLMALWPTTMADGMYVLRATVIYMTDQSYCEHMSQEFSLAVSGGVLAVVRIFQTGPGGGSGGGVNMT